LTAPKKKLIIVSASTRLNYTEDPIPAIERFDGANFRVLRKAISDGRMKDTQVLVLHEKEGLLKQNQSVPYIEPEGKIGVLTINAKSAHSLRLKNLELLKREMENCSEIYVNVGKHYLKLIEGFQNHTKARVTFAQGRLGEKAAHMQDWIRS
jgi:hypothetical protein